MRFIFLIIATLGAINGFAVSAETTSSSSKAITFIPTAGLAIFSVSGSSYTSNTNGFAGGVLSDVGIGLESLKFETGLLYLQEGASANSVTVTLNYLAIPLFAKYAVAETGDFGFYVKGGLMPSILLNSKASASSVSIDLTSSTSGFDLQAALGVGASFAVNDTFGLTLDVMFDRGLLTIDKNGGDSLFNQGFLVMVGAAF